MIILLLVGMASWVGSVWMDPGKFWHLTFFGLGISLTSTALVSLLNHVFRTDLPALLDVNTRITEERINLNRQILETGLTSVTLGIGDEEIFNRFWLADAIDIMKNTAQDTVHRYAERLESAIRKNGCRVRILISDPANPVWDSEAIVCGICPGKQIPSEIQAVKVRVEQLVNTLKTVPPRPKAGSLELRYLPCLPTCGIVIVDHKIIRHIPYLPYSHSVDVPQFGITKVTGSGLYDRFFETFEKAWGLSQKVVEEDFSASDGTKK